jgi:SHO1 osmosensor
MHRFQISVFGAVAIVFSVNGVQFNVPSAAVKAMSAGWLILAMVNILWVLYFTSEEDSIAFHIFNSLGNGGLTPPSRRRRTHRQSSMHNMGSGNGYAGYSAGGGIGSQEVAYDSKVGGGYGSAGNGIRSQNSFAGSIDVANRSIGAGAGGAGSINNATITNAGSIAAADNGPHSPLMAGIGAGNSQGTNSAVESPPQPVDTFAYKARALYACAYLSSFLH